MNKKLNYFTTIRFLWNYAKKYQKNFIMFYLGWLTDTVLSVAMPILFGIMIDEIVYYQNLSAFLQISLVFVVVSLFSCSLYFLIYSQHHYLMNMYTFHIKKDLFDHFLRCDSQYLSDASHGDILAAIQVYTEECMHFVIRNVIHTVNNALLLISVSVYLFLIRWQIGLFVLIAAPFSVWANAKYGGKLRKIGEEQVASYNQYISWVFEMLSSIRELRLLGAEKKADSGFHSHQVQMLKLKRSSGIAGFTAESIMRFTSLAVQMSLFILAGYFAVSGEITIGILTIIVSFYEILSRTFLNLSRSILDAQNRISSIQHIHDFLNAPTEDTWAGKDELSITNGDIRFENITFSYGASSILDHFSLDIPAGTRFALAGHSGCGKTTLAHMLVGFYSPQSGEIIIDGQKLSACSLQSIRQNIGLVAQEVLIFRGTLRENLLLGNKRMDDSALLSACTHAGLKKFINTLPDGLDTMLGINGSGLSGGQKQRISIARIYLRNPRIIIFDEATSALDSETEEVIHDAWETVLRGRTVLVIAHRLSSVMMCSGAAILDSGKVIECGKPSELCRNSTSFRTLFALKEDN